MVNLNVLAEQSLSLIQQLQQTVNRLFAIEDYEGAVPICEELCSEVSKVHGELHDSCAEPYYQYATALLELAREENQLLAASRLDEGPGEGINDEDEQEEPDSTPAASNLADSTPATSTDSTPTESTPTASTSTNSTVATSAPADSTPAAADSTPSPSDATSAASADSTPATSATSTVASADSTPAAADSTPAPSDFAASADSTPAASATSTVADSSVPDNDEEEEDITSLQIAWEVLELSRVIYTRHHNNESYKKLAKVEIKLGEVCMENEKMGEAIEHFETSIRTFLRGGEQPYSKEISSTYYLMGLAASLDQKYQNAHGYYSKCTEIMSVSIADLETKEESEEKEGQIITLCAMRSEVQQMVQDCSDSLKQMEQYNIIKQSLASTTQATPSSSTAASSSVPQSSNGFCTSSASSSSSVTNISHLVRKTPASSTVPSSPTVSSSSNSSGKATLQVSPMVSSTSSVRSTLPSSSSPSSSVSSSLDRRMGSSTGFTTTGFNNSEAAAVPIISTFRAAKPQVAKVTSVQRSEDITSSSDITTKRITDQSDDSNEAKRRRH